MRMELKMEFNAMQRCDSCGAQAHHMTTLDGTPSELLWCNHHLTKHKLALKEGGWHIESDEEFSQDREKVIINS